MTKFFKLLKAMSACAVDFAPRIFVLLIIFYLIRLAEFIFATIMFGTIDNYSMVIFSAFIKDLAFIGSLTIWLYIVYFIFYSINKKFAHATFIVFAVALCLVQVSLIKYFLTALAPLGGDLWGYSFAEITQTVGAAGGISLLTVATALVTTAGVILLLVKLPRRLKINSHFLLLLPLASFFVQFFNIAAKADNWKPDTNTYANYLATDKTYFFFEKSYDYFFPKEDLDADIYADNYAGLNSEKDVSVNNSFSYVDEKEYPFLHLEQTKDVLGPYFDSSSVKPNIVIVLVEGLGRSFSNEGAPLGDFTPFLDSLSTQSLYWSNCLSEGGRTFAVLPSLTGSLPFGKNGFAEMGESMPKQLNLISLLKHNGYHTAFYYGGDARFDNMNIFLKHSAIDQINDINSFPSTGYIKEPSVQGFTWGYDDKALFKRYLETLPNNTAPRLDILLTVSTHSPFQVNEQQKYIDLVEKRINQLGYSGERKDEIEKCKNQFATIMYTDDAIRNFITAYAARPEFNHTIFLVTGDHRIPEIPMNDKLERYHVPFIVYSPMLSRTAKFSSISTHFDIAPSLLAYLKNAFNLDLPSEVTWMGTGLDTLRNFDNTHAYPIMQTKTELSDFVYGKYFLSGNDLYTINQNMGLAITEDKQMKNTVEAAFIKFKEKNSTVTGNAQLMPDSLYSRYYPK